MTTDSGSRPTPAEWEDALGAAHALISKGQLSEALAQTESLLAKPGANESVLGSCAGFLIDIGSHSEEPTLIERGVTILEGLLEIKLPRATRRIIQYNLANGLDSLGRLQVMAQAWTYWNLQENESCRRAKHLFAELLEDEKTGASPEHWVNYGNRLSLVGRKLEALYAYDQALHLNPGHPMAKGNKGEALEAIAPRLGVSRAEALHEAGRLLAQATSDPKLAGIGGAQAREHWGSDLKRIEGILGKAIRADEPRTHRPADLAALSPLMKRFVAFSRDERLFLTYHLCDEEASAALRDDVFVETLEEESGASRFPGLAIRFNQIKEDYAVARYLTFLSLDRDPDRDAVSRTTLFADLRDGAVSHLYGGLLKAAFGQGFDVLDKIAFLVNEYLGLGIPSRRTGFRVFWRDDADLKAKVPASATRIRKSLRDRDDYGVVSLVDLALDLEHVQYKRISDLRNAQTHRCLVLTKKALHGSDPEGLMRIEYESMIRETLRLLRIVKSALFSVAVLVSAEERRCSGKDPKRVIRREIPVEQDLELPDRDGPGEHRE